MLLNEMVVRVLITLHNNPGITFNKLYNIVRGNRNKLKEIIDWLVEKGLVERIELDKSNFKGFPVRYRNPHSLSLTPLGEEVLDLIIKLNKLIG